MSLMREQCLQSAITVTCPEGQEVFHMPLKLWHMNLPKRTGKEMFQTLEQRLLLRKKGRIPAS